MFDEILDTSTFPISDFILDIPKDIKVRKDDERLYIQRQIENILNAEDIRMANLPRYRAFLKEKKLRHNEESKALWLKCKDKQFKKMEKIPKQTFGIFTRRFNNEQLYRVLSECQDLYNRKQSPNIYAWSLRKRIV